MKSLYEATQLVFLINLIYILLNLSDVSDDENVVVTLIFLSKETDLISGVDIGLSIFIVLLTLFENS